MSVKFEGDTIEEVFNSISSSIHIRPLSIESKSDLDMFNKIVVDYVVLCIDDDDDETRVFCKELLDLSVMRFGNDKSKEAERLEAEQQQTHSS